MAIVPNLSLFPSEHIYISHLHHRRPKLLPPNRPIFDIVHHQLPRQRALEQRLIRGQQPRPLRQPPVILVIENCRRRNVVVDDRITVTSRRRAPVKDTWTLLQRY